MRLADFIVSNIEPILMEWEVFARGIGPGAKMDALATVQDMKSSQSAAERSAKSRGHHAYCGGGTGGGTAQRSTARNSMAHPSCMRSADWAPGLI
jgi:hypothetical protein